MSEFNIEVEGGSSVRLPTAGKYCDRDIVVTAKGGSGDASDIEAQWVAAIERWSTPVTKIPDGITRIGGYAFSDCSNLALTSLPSGITSIGNYAFQNCSNLALTSLPSGITSISNYAFYNCTGLTELTFEGTPTTIHNKAFDTCVNLKTINVPWAEGEVANAPWGATNATINYNYRGG